MKHVIKLLMLVLVTTAYGQSNDSKLKLNSDDISLRSADISVSVNSAEDVKSTFKVSDIKELIENVKSNGALNFELICTEKGKALPNMSSLTYSVKGNANNSESFLQRVKRVRKAAIKYYKNRS